MKHKEEVHQEGTEDQEELTYPYRIKLVVGSNVKNIFRLTLPCYSSFTHVITETW